MDGPLSIDMLQTFLRVVNCLNFGIFHGFEDWNLLEEIQQGFSNQVRNPKMYYFNWYYSWTIWLTLLAMLDLAGGFCFISDFCCFTRVWLASSCCFLQEQIDANCFFCFFLFKADGVKSLMFLQIDEASYNLQVQFIYSWPKYLRYQRCPTFHLCSADF